MNVKLHFLLKITIFCLMSNVIFAQEKTQLFDNERITVGAARFEKYIKKLKNKNVAMVVNQTSVIGRNQTHLVDSLLKRGIAIKKIFAPEHGFRGDADAGEKITNGLDPKTGIPIVSLYGKKSKPDAEDLKNIDVLVFDIQDVGVRFYTYISTLQYIMEAAAEQKKPIFVLDRPNPNGHFIDGPVLEKSLTSFVGMQPVPIVYGMTIGEYAKMLNTERWLTGGLKANLCVVPCVGYDHNSFYELPVKPSPNLPNARAIYLYASLCFFEGANVSVGRGTNKQFQIYGTPQYPKEKTSFSFTPKPMDGAKKPFLEGQECFGFDLTDESKYMIIKDLQKNKKIDLTFLLKIYTDFTDKNSFFLKGNFFDKLAGTTQLRQQLIDGKSEADIRASWQAGLTRFKQIRKKYLLYKDFP